MDVMIASNERDAQAVDTIVEHHAQMTGALTAAVETLVAATAGGDAGAAGQARERLVQWCKRELIPHAQAEEESLYPLAEQLPEGRLLIAGMRADHEALVALVREVEQATVAVRAATAARALQTLFGVHADKENDQVVPLLAAAPDVSVADALDGMHASLEQAASALDAAEAASHGTCACGGHDDPGIPELDVQTIPHAIRHATIFGALDAIAPGGGLVIAANHDPIPLLAQLEQRSPGAFQVDYLQRGPEQWKVRFLRAA